MQQQIADVQTNVDESVTAALVRSLLAALFAVAAIAVLAVFVARGVVTPLKKAVVAMNDIAQGDGDLTRRLDDNGKDELIQLAQAFNAFADDVADLVRHVRHSAAEMDESVASLTAVMSDAEKGVSEQQAQSEQAATAINEMAAASQEVAQSASEAAEAANDAEHKVRKAH